MIRLFSAHSSRVNLEQRIGDKSAVVGVIGLGYVGLPLARTFAAAGFNVLGFDTDPAKVDQLLAGRSYIRHVAAEWVRETVDSGRFRPTADAQQLAQADALLICVPTPLTDSRDPDLHYIEETAQQIRRRLRRGQLVVLESTTYPGTTRNVVLPLLAQSGLKLGEDFFLAYSPEREDPGNPDYCTAQIPKVVGGAEPRSARLAELLYGQAVQRVVAVSGCEVAEACKILENTYRSVNIALVNELKVVFAHMGIDIWEVVEAAKTKPFGYQAFYPGPGLGGHCIPIDPFYLSWLARKHGLWTRFIELAGQVNSDMPQYVVHRVAEALNQAGKPLRASKVCVLGVAYKKDVDDPRESPSFVLLELLSRAGVTVSYNDPHVPRLPAMRHHPAMDLSSIELTPEFLAAQDAVLIATDHSTYDYPFIVEHASLVIDSRNATRHVTIGRDKIWKA